MRSLVAVLALVLVGCGASSALPPVTPEPTHASATPTAVASATSAPAAQCHLRGATPADLILGPSSTTPYVLPDPSCTPGAVNPDVTQSNVATTICRSGWTKMIRPPVSYTEPLKLQQMAAYGESGSPRGYEEDHLISLELGGSPTDPRNLWPEPGASPNPKDRVENAAHRAVCSGQMTLGQAQHDIATDWVALGRRLGV